MKTLFKKIIIAILKLEAKIIFGQIQAENYRRQRNGW